MLAIQQMQHPLRDNADNIPHYLVPATDLMSDLLTRPISRFVKKQMVPLAHYPSRTSAYMPMVMAISPAQTFPDRPG